MFFDLVILNFRSLGIFFRKFKGEDIRVYSWRCKLIMVNKKMLFNLILGDYGLF